MKSNCSRVRQGALAVPFIVGIMYVIMCFLVIVVGDGMDDLPLIMDAVMIMARHRHRTGHDKLAKLNLHH